MLYSICWFLPSFCESINASKSGQHKLSDSISQCIWRTGGQCPLVENFRSFMVGTAYAVCLWLWLHFPKAGCTSAVLKAVSTSVVLVITSSIHPALCEPRTCWVILTSLGTSVYWLVPTTAMRKQCKLWKKIRSKIHLSFPPPTHRDSHQEWFSAHLVGCYAW